MKKEKYTVAYSGEFEGYKNFRKLKTLIAFINRIPDYELKNTICAKWEHGTAYIGRYYRAKSGLRVLF